MSEMEKVRQYIKSEKAPKKSVCAYSICIAEIDAFYHAVSENPWDAILLLFHYGWAKGHRAAKAEARRGQG